MLKKLFLGSGRTDKQAISFAIEQFDEYIRTFNNVQFVEKFNISDNAYRWIYLINGFENLYFCVEGNSTGSSNSYVYASIRLLSNIHNTSNSSGAVFYNWIDAKYGNGNAFESYIIASNNDIKGITFSPVNAINLLSNPFIMFVAQDNTNCVIVPPKGAVSNQGFAYLDDSNGTRLYLSKYGTINYTGDNVALVQNRIIVNTSDEYNAPYAIKLDEIFNIMNTQFWNNNAAVLLEINGTRYRKIAADYSFTYDGDTE
jgi:hypothetical protein